MKTFEFKSAVCTSKEQSERLLALGLKKETADMVYMPHYKNERLYCYFDAQVLNDSISQYMSTDPLFVDYIPAWSLHRLIAMIADTPLQVGSQVGIHIEDTYDMLIQGIEWLISRGQFNKDYLEERV